LLSVVIPAWNEAKNLSRYPKELLPVLETIGMPFEVVIVDDGSRDDTSRLGAGLGAWARVVRHERNQGLAAALRTGFAAAKGSLLVTLDADLTFAPALIPKLLERFQVGDADIVSGSPKLAGYGDDIPSYRVWVSHAATAVYSNLLGQRVTAVSPILRLYRTADLQNLELSSAGFEINAEILYCLIRRGKRVAEIPAPLSQRIHGQSSLRYRREMVRHLKLVRRMVNWRLANYLHARA
jgi:dolichol-phosphate mannosyltransferase